MSGLTPWRNGLEPPKGEDADRILQENFDTQAKFNDKIGLYLVGEAKDTSSQVVSSTSYVDVTGLKASMATSGGLVVIQGALVIQNNANNATYRLLEGDTELMVGVWGTNANTLTNTLPIYWSGNLKEGQKVFKVQAKTDSTPITVKASGSNFFKVLEFTKG